jgi:hypothetical protein
MADEQPVTATPEVAEPTEKAVETGSAPDAPQEPTESKPPQEGSEPEKPLGEKGTAELIRLRKRAQDAERERDYFKGFADGSKKPEPVVTQAAPPQEPKIDDFDNYDDFVVAKATHKIRQENQQAERQRQVESYERNWNDRLREAQTKNPEVQDAINTVGHKISREMATVIKDSEVGPDITLHLYKNPSEIDRILRLHPVSMAREIGKIEAKLQSAPMESKPNKITQAPEPIKPVGGRTQAVTTDLEKVPVDDFMSKRNSESFIKDGRGRLVPKR